MLPKAGVTQVSPEEGEQSLQKGLLVHISNFRSTRNLATHLRSSKKSEIH